MNEIEPQMNPPGVRGNVSVATLDNYWYVACLSEELKKTPLRRTVLGTPIVLFRNGLGQVGALLDRCPHRNVPLSLGTVLDNGNLECCYHGWQFDVAGRCREVPGLVGSGESRGRRVQGYMCRERDGVVGVYGQPDAEQPEHEPFDLPLTRDRRYTTVYREFEAEATVHATAENALDVPHTAYLHRGLFRGGDKNRIDVVVRRWADRVEAEYIGEPRPPGVIGKLLSPSGGIVEHWDRFFLPSVAQVEYKIGSENHIVVTSLMTPVTDFFTKLYAVISFRTRIPGRLIQPVVEPVANRIFQQDAEVLKIQTETIHQFGGEQYMSTDIDVLGRDIWRLLRQAERRSDEDEPELGRDDEPVVRELKIEV